jgi:hypothetical protein
MHGKGGHGPPDGAGFSVTGVKITA